MSNAHSTGAISIVVLLMFLAIALAGIIWLLFPRWLGRRFGKDTNSDALAIEDAYRKAMSQVLGFPLAIFGAIGAYLTVATGLEAYDKAIAADFQDRFRRGFDMLASTETGTRIGGLHILEDLLIVPQKPNPKLPDNDANAQRNTILQSIAAYAVDHSLAARPGGKDPVAAQDAQVALRIIGRWNVYIPDFPVDLRGGYFLGVFAPHANLDHANLYAANFGGSDFYQGSFLQANLRDANFNGSNLTDVIFSSAGFSNTTFCASQNFSTAEFMNDDPREARMANAQFENATGRGVYFDAAYLPRANYNYVALSTVTFIGAELSDTTFLSANLSDADFTGANLERALFDKDPKPIAVPHGTPIPHAPALLNHVTFDDAKLAGATFGHATLTRAQFRNADLQGAHFKDSVIQNADFTDADLTNAQFQDVTLTASQFDGAILHHTSFAHTQIDSQALSKAIHCDEPPEAGHVPNPRCNQATPFELHHTGSLPAHCASKATVRPVPVTKPKAADTPPSARPDT
jgi:uncharacterized protein YjbI with pentapeptide repeats